MDRFKALVKLAVNEGYSDIHMSGDHPIVCRKNGKMIFTDNKYTPKQMDELALKLLVPHELDMLKSRLSVDLARTIEHIRVRMNMFFSTRGLSLAIRLLPGRIPNFTDLNLYPGLKEYCKLSSGLILICGPTGSGKSSTIAAFLSEMNRTQSKHIITLEDPIEYRFNSNKSYIEQRELGFHIQSFNQGLLDVLREDPDVIMVGELREPETIRLTLNAVEAGHLVIASLHASNSEDALYRICNSFPPDAQDVVRTQLSSVLSLLCVQKLQYFPNAGFRVPVLSVLNGANSVKTTIRENRFAQIEGILQTSRKQGMFTQEKYISEFINKEKHLVPPMISFKPSPESIKTKIIRSSLMENKVATPASRRQVQFQPPPATPSTGNIAARKDANGQYMISDSSSIEDVLAQMNPSDNKLF